MYTDEIMQLKYDTQIQFQLFFHCGERLTTKIVWPRGRAIRLLLLRLLLMWQGQQPAVVLETADKAGEGTDNHRHHIRLFPSCCTGDDRHPGCR